MVTKAQKTTSREGKTSDIGWKCLFSVFLSGIACAVVEKPASESVRIPLPLMQPTCLTFRPGDWVSYPSKKQYRNTEACAVNTVGNIDVLVFRSFRLARCWPKAVFIFINFLNIFFPHGAMENRPQFFASLVHKINLSNGVLSAGHYGIDDRGFFDQKIRAFRNPLPRT